MLSACSDVAVAENLDVLNDSDFLWGEQPAHISILREHNTPKRMAGWRCGRCIPARIVVVDRRLREPLCFRPGADTNRFRVSSQRTSRSRGSTTCHGARLRVMTHRACMPPPDGLPQHVQDPTDNQMVKSDTLHWGEQPAHISISLEHDKSRRTAG